MITTISSSRGSRSENSDSRADRILPGIQVGCVMYGAWGMHRGRLGIMGIVRSSMGRVRGGRPKGSSNKM